mgnify:CR=1 FL=1
MENDVFKSKKYQELRDGLKEEVGISKEKYVEPVQNDDDDDDFLSFMKKDKEEKEVKFRRYFNRN